MNTQRDRWRFYKATQRMYPLWGQPCEVEGCHQTAACRHHIDNNPENIDSLNVERLCVRHHRAFDTLILSHAEIAAIRDSGLSGASLGVRYGISKSYCNKIRAGTRLKDGRL